MSKASTRAGRMVTVKDSDTENMDRNTGSPLTEGPKSLSATGAKKGRPSKRMSMEDKIPKNEAVLKNQQDMTKCTVKMSPLPSSPGRVKVAKPGGREIPKSTTISVPAVTAEIELDNGSPVISDKKQSDGDAREAATPLSGVRRSGRAPVPSSKYKDMELDLRKSKKRLNTSDETEGEIQQIKKIRKISEKPATGVEHVSSASVNAPTKDHPPALSSVDETVSLSADNTTPSYVTETDLQNEGGTANVKSESMEVQLVDVAGQPAPEHNSPSTPSHTAEVAISTDNNMTPFLGIKINTQQMTFTEQDGETVTVVSIPSSSLKEEAVEEHAMLDSSPQDHCITFETVDSEQERRNFSELVTVNPTVHNLGHVVKRELVNTPFATVVGQDGATYLNLSVEATKISSILKGKHVSTTAKASNPLKGHGRVLRSPAGSMIMKTSIVPPGVPQQDLLEAKPSVTFSLLCPKKPQGDQCTYSVPRTMAVPVSVLSQVNQSPQRILIRQQSQQQPTVSEVPATQPNDCTVTVINFSQENIAAPTYSSDDIKAPKTASEILLHRLKLQSKLATAKEVSHVDENVIQEPTSIQETNDPTTGDHVQVIEDNDEHMDVAGTADTVVEDSHYVLSLDDEDGSKNNAADVDCGDNFHVVTVTVNTQGENVAKDHLAENAVSESTHVDQGEDIAGPNVNQTTVEHLTESTDNSEENSAVNDNTAANQSTSTTVSVLRNASPKDIETDISSENAPVEGVGYEQKPVTKLVSLSSLASATIGKDKDHFIDKIRVVDNGVEYDVRIVSEEEVAEEIIDNATSHILQLGACLDNVRKNKYIVNEGKQSEGSTAEVEPEIIIKQETMDKDFKPEVEKQTSGTQTVYSPQVQSATTLPGTNATTTHTLTTVVDEGSEKKHVYYVSVIPNKGIMAKTKTSMYSSAASWVIDDNGMYCCEKCDYQTERKANFYKHRRSHTGAKPHVCSVCQYKAGTSSNLKRHMGIHKDIREHRCDICNLSFRQKIHLERHIKYKHEEKSIMCPLCDYICANEQPDLKMHIKRKHSNESSGEVVTCPECKAQVGNRKDLKQHMKFHRDGPELKLFCKDCSFVTDCQSRLKRHTAIHSKMKPFQCGICNYRAAQKEHVLRHLRTQHKIDIKRDGKRPWKRHKKTALGEISKERADFTSGDKIFACNHCTMRFAKLINLYKHLHTQHGDIMPAETDGNFYCVVCEFSTTNKKNLLVHMRRHNMTDQTPPTHVYSCVLCRYVNPRRRNLFQHMRKKHNINISRQSEGMDGDEDGESQEEDIIGSVNRALTSNSNTVSVSAAETPDSLSHGMTGDLTSVASVIKIEDLTRMASGGDHDDVQALVIDGRPAEVVRTTAHTADALEGLQALAEQAGLIENIIEEQVPVIDEQHTVVIDQNGSNTSEVVETVETVDDQLQRMIQSTESLTSAGGEQTEGLELSEDQLSSLRNGDMVEMEGHLYLVELSQDPSSPHKQVFSFLPVTTASISQDTPTHD